MSAPRILVVDDNPELLTLLSSAFEEAGYLVQTASRGRTALDLARKQKPALAVLDVLLPDLMGYEVAEALKRLRVPFVFMSGVHKGGKAADTALHKYGALAFFAGGASALSFLLSSFRPMARCSRSVSSGVSA